MIKSLKLSNFQSHDKTELTFSTGVNAKMMPNHTPSQSRFALQTTAIPPVRVGAVVRPSRITEEMKRFARTDDLWRYAANLNAMLEHGYCNKCGLTPNGCEREGCRANAGAVPRRGSDVGTSPLLGVPKIGGNP